VSGHFEVCTRMFSGQRIGYSQDVDADVHEPPGQSAQQAYERRGLRALFRRTWAEDDGTAEDAESGGVESDDIDPGDIDPGDTDAGVTGPGGAGPASSDGTEASPTAATRAVASST
jgi:hypothetical protein